jgi:hypothetical protein
MVMFLGSAFGSDLDRAPGLRRGWGLLEWNLTVSGHAW